MLSKTKNKYSTSTVLYFKYSQLNTKLDIGIYIYIYIHIYIHILLYINIYLHTIPYAQIKGGVHLVLVTPYYTYSPKTIHNL